MKKILFSLIIIVFTLAACNRDPHFLTNSDYRAAVSAQFEKQKALAVNRDTALFSVFKQELSLQEEEALKFLYAYMPLSDLADYDGDFFLKNVRCTFAAKDTFSWGKEIPEEIFRHFVLPVRINNENMDTARMVFFDQLKDRVKGLGMKDAILEVNHWCHENVSYKSTDSRTSSPLATVQTAYGRCGEESTLTVAAMRSVGIPARQCYTPRWAHTDDNHAWVEVWADGKWYFLGACEPEYDLNLAWFTGPAYRAMIVGTNVYGDYRGPEEVLFKNEYYTRINLISNYAPVKTFHVKVRDAKGAACDSAEVEFCLYNYAEFFPVARKFTDANGLTQLNTGLGDMLVWASNGKDFGFEKVTVEKTDTVTIVLNKSQDQLSYIEMDLVPPVERPVAANDAPEKQERNQKMLKREDSIRNAYIAGFADSLSAIRLADEHRFNRDSVWDVMNRSEGNWKVIAAFLSSVPKETHDLALPFLYAIAEKDLRDCPLDVLHEHLQSGSKFLTTPSTVAKNIFIQYVMNPRIAQEHLRVFRSPVAKVLGSEWGKSHDVKAVIKWINENITINKVANYYNVPASPAGTLALRVADKHSRDILFVAICRTYHYPARIEPSTRKPQYYAEGDWVDVNFEKPEKVNPAKGIIHIVNGSKDKSFNPVYYVHYTLAIFKEGKYKTLDYEGAPEVADLPATLELEAGHYLMVTGSRRADGSVMAGLQFFDLPAKGEKEVVVRLRDNPVQQTVLGTLEPGLSVVTFKNEALKMSLMPGTSKAKIVLWIDPDKEPTKHVIAEILQLKQSYDKNGSPLLLVLTDKTAASFSADKYKGMPENTGFGVDKGAVAMKKLEAAVKKNVSSDLPVIAVITAKGEIIYLSSGYSIGTGERLLKVVNAL